MEGGQDPVPGLRGLRLRYSRARAGAPWRLWAHPCLLLMGRLWGGGQEGGTKWVQPKPKGRRALPSREPNEGAGGEEGKQGAASETQRSEHRQAGAADGWHMRGEEQGCQEMVLTRRASPTRWSQVSLDLL